MTWLWFWLLSGACFAFGFILGAGIERRNSMPKPPIPPIDPIDEIDIETDDYL